MANKVVYINLLLTVTLTLTSFDSESQTTHAVARDLNLGGSGEYHTMSAELAIKRDIFVDAVLRVPASEIMALRSGVKVLISRHRRTREFIGDPKAILPPRYRVNPH